MTFSLTLRYVVLLKTLETICVCVFADGSKWEYDQCHSGSRSRKSPSPVPNGKLASYMLGLTPEFTAAPIPLHRISACTTTTTGKVQHIQNCFGENCQLGVVFQVLKSGFSDGSVENVLNFYYSFILGQLFFCIEPLVRAFDQNIIDRQGLLMHVLMLFYSQASTELQILRVLTGPVLTNDCSPSTLVPRIPFVYSRYRSRPDHSLATRPRNSQQTIRGTVIRSTAAKNKRKKEIKKILHYNSHVVHFCA